MKRNNFEIYEKQYYKSKDWVVPYSQIPQGSNIILYGAGDVGQAYYMQLMYTGYCNIVAWVDQKADMYNGWGLEVVSPDAINEYKYDYVLIAVADLLTAKFINKLLLSMNVEQGKILWIGYERSTINSTVHSHYMSDAITEEIERYCENCGIKRESAEYHEYYAAVLRDVEDDEKIVLPRLVVQLTERCTLKCKGCNNLMPNHEVPKDYIVDEIIESIANISKLVDRIMVMELIGGEPFIYPQLVKVLAQIDLIKNIDHIEITTNGTIVPGEEVLQYIRRMNILVRISRYDKSVRIADLIHSLSINNIKHKVLEEMVWYDASCVSKREMNQFEELLTNYKCSSPKLCKTLSNGKFFYCARAASLYNLGICTDKRNYVLADEFCSKDELKRFIEFPYGSACNYCTCTDRWRIIEAGVQ